ncbi:MAG: TIGR02117 family protein [Verrucomicrobiales bacterium]|nr:TIGR02117 family protein [Verrucomicrobiales bacterium]
MWQRIRGRWSALPAWLRWSVKGASAVVAAPVAMVSCYLLLAWGLSSSVVNEEFQDASDGVEIFLWSNGVHVDLVVPRRTDLFDWSAWCPASHVKGRMTGPWVAMGWGNRRIYLEVPEWEDLTLGVALESVFIPGATVMHVSNVWDIQAASRTRRIVLTRKQYRRLVEHIQSGFALQPSGIPERIGEFSYGDHDAFYEGNGKYSAFLTCNEWSASGLRKAGVKVGRWTPLESHLMKHFPAVEESGEGE